MGRYGTGVLLFDEVKNISIKSLGKWNYLNEGCIKCGTITWSKNGIKTSAISITMVMKEYDRHLKLNYTCDSKPYNYKVKLVSLPSNLGKGNIWYFICPFTLVRCTKLHFISERFMHRSALPSGMYSTQTHSKKWRWMERNYGAYFDSEKHYEELYSKHFTKYYNGKPTKRYLKLKSKIKQYEAMSVSEIEQLFLM